MLGADWGRFLPVEHSPLGGPIPSTRRSPPAAAADVSRDQPQTAALIHSRVVAPEPYRVSTPARSKVVSPAGAEETLVDASVSTFEVGTV